MEEGLIFEIFCVCRPACDKLDINTSLAVLETNLHWNVRK